MTTSSDAKPAHSSWGPSSAARRIACPGSLAAEAQLPDTDNEHAVIGSAAHALAEEVLTQGQDGVDLLEVGDFLGETMFVPKCEDLALPIEFDDDQVNRRIEGEHMGYDVLVDHDMVSNVQEFVDRVSRYRVAKHAQYFSAEQQYDLNTWLPGNFGTADVVAVVGNTLHVDDLKYGKGVKVFAKENAQGRCYALGALDRYGMLFDVDTVKITIDQPRLDHLDDEDLSVGELLHWADTVLVPAYEASMQPDAPRLPGDSQCRFCKAKATCPELAMMLQEEVQNNFPILSGDKDIDGDIIPLPLAELATHWAKAVEAYAIQRLMAGEDVYDGEQHYKLVHGRGSRSWKDEAKVRRKLGNMRISRDEFMTEPKLKSVAQVEKLVGKKKLSEKLASLIDKKEGKPTLAPESDKRKAINSADALGFEDETKTGEQ